MADFKIDRLKYRWKGNWTSGLSYIKDDIVYYNGKAYVCLQGHVASQNFYEDEDGQETLTYSVTVGTDTVDGKASGNFYINGIESAEINLIKGKTYIFDQSDETNINFNGSENPLLFSTGENGTLNGFNVFTVGVTYFLNDIEVTHENYVENFTNSETRQIQLIVPSIVSDELYYFSPNNINIGGKFNTKYDSFWELMFDGRSWNSEWTTNRFYSEGNIVKYNSSVYICLNSHTSAQTISDGLEANNSDWILLSSVEGWTSEWSTSTRYVLNDLVKYGGIVYKCINPHTSAETEELGLEDDIDNWEIVSYGIEYKGQWTSGTRYKEGDLVKNGPTLWRATTGHTATPIRYVLEKTDGSIILPTISHDTLADAISVIASRDAPFDAELQNLLLIDPESGLLTEDDPVLGYYAGSYADVDRNNNIELLDAQEIALYNSTGSASNSTITEFIRNVLYPYIEANGYTVTELLGYQRNDIDNWEVYVPGLAYDELWNSNTRYQIGDVVLYGGYSYIALQSNLNSVPSVNGKDQNIGDWELLINGYRMTGDWNSNEVYKTGDLVRDGGYLYIALDDNTAIYPDSDVTIWQKLVEGNKFRGNWQDDVEYFLGDIVTFLGTAYVCIQRHFSTASDSRPDIDVLQTDQDYWNLLIQGAETIVLQEEGDLKIRNDLDIDERFAIGNINDQLTTDGTLPQWKSLVSIPRAFYVSNQGQDADGYGKNENSPFRTVKYACDYVRNNIPGTLNTSVISGKYILQIALETIIADGDTSTFPNLSSFLRSTNEKTGRAWGDVDLSTSGITITDSNEIQKYFNNTITNISVKNLINELVKYISYNTELFVDEYIVVSEVNYSILNSTPPNTTIFVKTGYYDEILPISIPQNCAVVGEELRSTTVAPAAGYETSNMFYVRNGSGLRNMSLVGLNGELGDLNEFLTRRPTAGAYVSLDPGTGSDDTSVWIQTRSPYVQNVSTSGSGCIGMKIDGALHNGGNRSIVANDFTQVLSDGIGYWADNLGRSELVSVFTYYCHIGYLSTNGGILRATNGNNSYGTFGSVAEGVDPTEAPIAGLIDNRSNQAQFSQAFTFGFNQQAFLAIGYSHAGENYTNASITFDGSGTGAVGYYDEFRQNAISRIRIIDLEDSSPVGGLNYTFIVNSLQGGNDGIITLSQAETATAEDIIGQRLVIQSGTGVGQYGEITAYDPLTKVCIISRESDGQLGFDHFQPGWPIEEELDSTSRYAIEPRVSVEEPIFTNSAVTGPSVLDWKYITYAEDRFIAINEGPDVFATYSTDGTNWEDPNLVGFGAIASGIVYTGSNLLVSKESVSGSPTNQVARSTNAAVSWSNVVLPTTDNWGPIASDKAGNAIIIAANGSQNVVYSTDDGNSWNTSTIGNGSENWIVSAFGNGKFVTISEGTGAVAYSSDNGASWTVINSALSEFTWTGITYGNGRFVAIADSSIDSTEGLTRTAYSFDGITWYESFIETGDFTRISYGAGVFLATGPGNLVAKSASGKVWKTFDNDSTAYTTTATGSWESSAYNDGKWIVVQNNSALWNSIETGARPIIRAKVEAARITEFIIYDPGSNLSENPVVEVIDNNFTLPVFFDVFVKNGVLPQPEMTNRGQGYLSATATITGDGFAELFQIGTTLKLTSVTRAPRPGANLSINGIDKQINIVRINSVTGTGPFEIEVLIRPEIGVNESPEHLTPVVIRERYSQIRLTGHDFLDIGTGNFEDTNYPNLYLEGESSINPRQPFNEVVANGGGRIFYTSTDQDGNFRTGELFAVEQSTGIVTIDASQFNLTGLEEISLGGIQLGGTNVIVREFSKDPRFLADSNNIVPTQRAIASYIANRVAGGDSNAQTNVLIAGQIQMQTNLITNRADLEIQIVNKMNMKGGIDGDYLAAQYFAAGGA
jgi:hypothetical protein